MKLTLVLLILAAFSGCVSPKAEGQKLADNQPLKTESITKQPVLVELFTSEGCSSCPPADRALTFLEKQQPNPEAQVVTLELHVTYWDDGGWKDQFSAPLFTQRQEIYSQKFNLDSIYTPQMVIDGNYELIGSDLTKAQKIISEAAKSKKAQVEISANPDKLKIKISELPAHRDASVYLAIAEDNLTTNIGGGENSGAKLEHNSVARLLQPIGMIDSKNNQYETEYALQLPSDWQKNNLRYIVFIQENESRKILGVNFLRIEGKAA